jgi:arginase
MEKSAMPTICIGVPYWLGERQRPSAVDVLKESGVARDFDAEWIDITPNFAAHPDPIAAVNRALAEVIRAHPEHTPLVFAADCVAALGALKGLERHHPAILWYDAHGDFNTWETTPSGFLGGMPVAALVGRDNAALMAAIGLAPFDERDVIITDARDLDPAEGDNLRASGLTHLPDVDALLTAPLPERPLYVHVDLDVIDPAEMPAHVYLAPGGPTTDQVAATLRRVRRDAEVVGVLFSLWDEAKDGAALTRENALRVIRALRD